MSPFPRPWHIIDGTQPSVCGGGYNLCNNKEKQLSFLIVSNDGKLVGSFCSRECAQNYVESNT